MTRFGLFGEVSSATIKNISIADIDITVPMKTGGLAAQILDSTVTNCYVTGKIVATGSSYSDFGGLLGYDSNCTVSDVMPM